MQRHGNLSACIGLSKVARHGPFIGKSSWTC